MADTSPWWAQLLGTLVGGIMTFMGGAFTQLMTTKREREVRHHEAEDRRKLQSDENQRKVLVEVQEAICRVIDAAFDANMKAKSIRFMRQETDTEHAPYPLEVLEPAVLFMKEQLKLHTLIAQVRDDAVRKLTEELSLSACQVKGAVTQGEEPRTNDMYQLFYKTNDRLGELIRSFGR